MLDIISIQMYKVNFVLGIMLKGSLQNKKSSGVFSGYS